MALRSLLEALWVSSATSPTTYRTYLMRQGNPVWCAMSVAADAPACAAAVTNNTCFKIAGTNYLANVSSSTSAGCCSRCQVRVQNKTKMWLASQTSCTRTCQSNIFTKGAGCETRLESRCDDDDESRCCAMLTCYLCLAGHQATASCIAFQWDFAHPWTKTKPVIVSNANS